MPYQSLKKMAARVCLLPVLWVAMSVPGAASPALPPRDLTIELRQIDEAKVQSADRADGAAALGKSYSAGAYANPEWEPQMVQVRNGETALLRVQSTVAMQWVQSALVQVDTAAAPAQSAQPAGNNPTAGKGHNGTHTAAGVQNALVWLDAGQSISVHPQWSGGKTARVALEVQKAGLEARTGADLPAQSRNAVSTTVTAPLAQWVTIAATGRAPQAASYSSEAAQQTRRLLQIRVMVP